MENTVIFDFSFVYIVPVFLFALIGLAAEGEFCRLSLDLSLHIDVEGEFKEQNGALVECFRRRHGKLCDFLELADEIFSLFCLITIGAGVFEIFSLVFVVSALGSDETRGLAMTLAQIYWFGIYVLQPWVVLWTGMRVNEAVCTTCRGLGHSLYERSHGLSGLCASITCRSHDSLWSPWCS